MTPGWILDIAAALMLAVAAVSALRLAAARPWQRGSVVADTDIAHLLMAIAMAGMLVTDLSTLPEAAWEVIFGVLAAWFTYRVIRDARTNGTRALAGGHCAPHLVHSAAMLYMFLALGTVGDAGQAMNGMGGPAAIQSLKVPTLGLVFAFILAGYTIWDLDQVSSRTRRVAPAGFALAAVRASAGPAMPVSATFSGTSGNGRGAGGALLSPGMTVACRIAMGATMTFMLLIMI
jgi:hypothetical protein